MARGGVTKLEVQDARKRILVRKENPSIDAIRAELGHTGSKTTISNHLKAIEQQENTQLGDEALLSQPIQKLVAQLAKQLQQEAQAGIEKAEARHTQEQADLQQQLVAFQEAEQGWQQEEAQYKARLKSLDARLLSYEQSDAALKQQVQQQTQATKELQHLLDEKQKHLNSLEDKYQHSRGAMTHYRHAVKEQRDQDMRRHEQQLQHSQAEQRKLQQTLVVKQEQITSITGDNTRLFTELREMRKQLESESKRLQQALSEYAQLNERRVQQEQQLTMQAAQISELEQNLQQAGEQAHSLDQLNLEIQIKNQLIEQLMRHQHAPLVENERTEKTEPDDG